jgi:hypothetical protein
LKVRPRLIAISKMEYCPKAKNNKPKIRNQRCLGDYKLEIFDSKNEKD